jgi:uncharacterized protein involved in exopolysaccharide biosynthesis
MNEKEENSKIQGKTDEIDLRQVFLLVWNERKFIYKVIAVFFAISIIFAFGSKTEYKTEISLLPEIQDQQGGSSGILKQFSSLSSLAGIDLSGLGSTDAIRPDLYPDIIHSTPFLLQLLDTKFKIPSLDTTVSLYVYMNDLERTSLVEWIKRATIKLPGTIIRFLKSFGSKPNTTAVDTLIIKLTKDQSDILKDLKDCLGADLDQKSGIISISVEVSDPYLSAQIANKTIEYLTNYVTEYRVGKAKKDMEFIKSRCEESKEKYIVAQRNLSQFSDANKNVILASVQSEMESLKAEFNLSFNLYNGLAQQLEQAKIQVQRVTPVFKVLEPVKIPIEKSKPKRLLIIIGMLFLGGIFALTIIFVKPMMAKFHLSFK